MLHAFAPALIAAALLLAAAARASAQTSPHRQQTPASPSPARDDEALKSLRVFDAKGAPVTLEQLVEAVGAADAVFVGEQHNDAGAHLLEAELLQRAFLRYARGEEKGRREVVLSLEFFERDVQTVLDEYLAGLISERHFLASTRPWKNYETDYRPLVEFARAHKIPVVAANAPARYVSRVTQNGPESLSALFEESRRSLPPLPVAPASTAYAEKFNAFLRGEAESAAAAAAPVTTPVTGQAGGVVNPHAQAPQHGGAALHLLDAQNLRDASMGHAVAESLKRRKRALVLHYNGAFHSEGRLGVPEQVARYRKGARLLVVTAVPASAYDAARMSGLGDYVVLTRNAP